MCALTIKREVEIPKWMIFRERRKILGKKSLKSTKNDFYGAHTDMEGPKKRTDS